MSCNHDHHGSHWYQGDTISPTHIKTLKRVCPNTLSRHFSCKKKEGGRSLLVDQISISDERNCPGGFLSSTSSTSVSLTDLDMTGLQDSTSTRVMHHYSGASTWALGAAIQTGLFDYAQVRIYDEDGCQYDGSFEGMKSAWDEWTADPNVDKIFAGVSACGCDQGYVDADDLACEFLPYAEQSPKFGGLMVWYVYTDHQSGYSARIKALNCTIQTVPSGVEVE